MSTSLEQQLHIFAAHEFEKQKEIVLDLLEIFRKYGDPFDIIDEYIRASENITKSDLIEVYTAIAQATEEEKVLEDATTMKKLQDIKNQLVLRKKEEELEKKQSQQEANALLSHF